MVAVMKYCIDCKHAFKANEYADFRCKLKSTIEPVEGETIYARCLAERATYDTISTCGIDAQYWEAKDENVA
jgi:hypothetical protein